MLNFPDSPVAGTVFGAWRYDGVKWGAVSGVSGGGSAGDITAVLAGTGLSGGGTEGDVSIALAVPVTLSRGGTGATDAATARTNLGAAPLDQGVTLTGDVSGSGAQNALVATTLATVNADIGTFQGLTINAKGLVMAAVNQSYLTSPVNLTSQVTGVLPIANGGSGGTTAAAAPWVVRTGDTMSGNLTLSPSGNTTFVIAPVTSGDARFEMRKAVSGAANIIYGRTGTSTRWAMVFGNSTAETGTGNAGSDFAINRYDDAASPLGTPISINRATGTITLSPALPVASGGTGATTGAEGPYLPLAGGTLTGALTLQPASGDCNLYLQRAAGSQNVIWGRTGSNARWGLALGDGASEAGSNAGSDFIVRRYNDAGTFIDAPLTITRSTGVTTITSTAEINLRPGANPGAVVLQNPGNLVASIGAILKIGFPGGGVQYGISMRPAADSTNMMMFYNAAGTSVGSISQTATATAFNTTSDARLKEDLQSFDASPIIDATNVYDYAWISTGEREYGVIAQEAIEVYPQAVTHTVIPEGDNWGVDYSKYVPVLLQELKALRERVRVLEGS